MGLKIDCFITVTVSNAQKPKAVARLLLLSGGKA
jgi:hypothetical protein